GSVSSKHATPCRAEPLVDIKAAKTETRDEDVYAITQRLVIKRVNSFCYFLRAVRTSPPVVSLCMSLRDGHLQWCVGQLERYELLPMLGPGKSPRSLQPLVKRRRGQGGE